MIAKIIKVSGNNIRCGDFKWNDIWTYSYNLPLFDINLDSAYRQEMSEYVLQLWMKVFKECRYPAWIRKLNEDQVKIINAYWDDAIKQNIDEIEFEI